MADIKTILMQQGDSAEEADDRIEDARSEFFELISEGKMETAYNICETHFGLEPDYLEEFIS
jgi:hypothetical protein